MTRLICERCYKPGWSHSEAVDCITSLSGMHFDPDVVAAFLAAEPEIAALREPDPATQGAPVCHDATDSFSATGMIAQANNEMIGLFELTQSLSSTLELDEVLSLLAHGPDGLRRRARA